jgi:hypothetical protein
VLRRALEHRVVAERVANEVGELGQCFDPRVACADEDEGQLAAAVRLGGGRGGDLEPREDVIPEMDRVAQGLEAERVVGEPWDRQCPGDGSERDDEVVVVDPEDALLGLDLYASPVAVVRDGTSENEVRVWAHDPERHDHVPRLECARGRLRQHRREEHEVLRADDRCAAAPESARDVGAGEPAADDQGSPSCFTVRHRH